MKNAIIAGFLIVVGTLAGSENASAVCTPVFVTRQCENGYNVRFGYCPGTAAAGGAAWVAACASYGGVKTPGYSRTSNPFKNIRVARDFDRSICRILGTCGRL